MNGTIHFGTDGWRAIIAQDFTFDNVRACALGVADYLKHHGLASRGIIVSYDTRFASEDFAAAAAEVIAAQGIKVYLCPKPTPTPVTSYGVLAQRSGGAIIITASHNPAQWNGFKLKSEEGSSAPTTAIAEVERRIAIILQEGKIQRLPLEKGLKEGFIQYLDLAPVYFAHVAELVDIDKIRRAGLKIAVDSMYGAGIGYFHSLLKGGKSKIKEIHQKRNPLFPGIRPEPIAPHLNALSALVQRSQADIGLATDGDADRLGVVDEKGNILTPQQVFALLALYLLEVRQERGAIVKTVASTRMLERMGKLFDVPVYETPVGFKDVAPRMKAENALFGGEESGGYGFRGHVLERDGILAGLYLLNMMGAMGKRPSELVDYLYSKVGPHHYHRLDIHFPPEERQRITQRMTEARPHILSGTTVRQKDTIDGFRFLLEDESWLLIRFSGTEPLMRIYAESSTPARVQDLLQAGKELAGA